MELTIQSVNFDATEQLKAFAEKKVKKLERFSDDIIQAEVILKVIKPDAASNKDAAVKLLLKHGEAYANKKADTFEEAIDLCTMAIEKQIMKTKSKKERQTTKN
ncbi:MAG: ribosome-associated translation inhibitor RaiA [Bacteroidales bacterium]|nr:ribosome-associated translation inhibitor RaiA [Bacteroidales bacterium]